MLMRANNCFDLIIVGGGIIGCATALRVKQRLPVSLRVALVEKESRVALHQSGRNSGVIHMGLYYKPHSLKAKLCQEGARKAFDYFHENNIAYKKCGKLVVAVDQSELDRLEKLFNNSLDNEVPDVRMCENLQQIQSIEPNCQGLAAIYSPHTSVVDWAQITRSFAHKFHSLGGETFLSFQVSRIHKTDDCGLGSDLDKEYPIHIKDGRSGHKLHCKYLLTCCGLHSDRVAALSAGVNKSNNSHPEITPVRGEYLAVSKKVAQSLVDTNIYPVPDPHFPFLGVHFTPRMDGSLWLGPNAIIALKREGYSYCDVSVSDTLQLVRNPGFVKLATSYFNMGVNELLDSLFIDRQIRKLQKYVPKLPKKEVFRVSAAGVRAQALNPDGSLVDDFVFDSDAASQSHKGGGCRILHVRNAPSPGATSSLAIADYLVDKMRDEFVDFS